jgi:hypothetical protein
VTIITVTGKTTRRDHCTLVRCTKCATSLVPTLDLHAAGARVNEELEVSTLSKASL